MNRASIMLLVVCVIALAGCGRKTAAEVEIDYGTSYIYTEDDMNAAIDLIKKEFYTWDGCELHSISYAGDDECSKSDNIVWMNDLKDANDGEETFTQCIIFKSDFHSPKKIVEHGIQIRNIQIGNGAWPVRMAVNGN